LVATGEPLEARRAYELGLVNRIAPADQVLDTALDLARVIASNAPVSVRESLKVARRAQEETDAALRAASAAGSRIVGATEDAKEGPRAFLEKRPARWQGR